LTEKVLPKEILAKKWICANGKTLTYFLENYEKLRGNITMQNLGIMNNDLRNQLLELKKKLLAAYVKRGFDSTSEKPLMNALNSGDYARALKEVNSLVVAYQSKMDGPKLIEKAIGDMITACTSPGNFSFDLIKGSRAERADMVTDMPAEQVEEVLASEKTFECPIMLDTDVPALLIAKPQLPILAGLEKDVVDDIINCPLNLWKVQRPRGQSSRITGPPCRLSIAQRRSLRNFTAHSPRTGRSRHARCRRRSLQSD
jgi:hypothetical protein